MSTEKDINTHISLKEIAVAFLQLVASGKVQEAFQNYICTGFIHHNPFFPGDANSLLDAMLDDATNNPDKKLEVKHVIGEHDKVAVHSYVKQNREDKGWAIIHIFRFENNKIIELWDLSQPVLENSPNENGMF